MSQSGDMAYEFSDRELTVQRKMPDGLGVNDFSNVCAAGLEEGQRAMARGGTVRPTPRAVISRILCARTGERRRHR